MDRITTGLLAEFVQEFNLGSLPEDRQFEHFATYVAVRRHYSETAFQTHDLVMGDGGDTGIDGIAIIVNNNLVTDEDDIDEVLALNGYLDVKFISIQSERSSSFDSAKIGSFGFGVRDFFGSGTLVRNTQIKNASTLMNKIFIKSARFTKGNPTVVMYYVTTGRWVSDQNLTARYETEVSYLKETGNFRDVEFIPVGADYLQRLYNQTKNAIQREFLLDQKVPLPPIKFVEQAYIGIIEARQLLKIICDENEKLIDSIFYDNVRGWEGYNEINTDIKNTIISDDNDRFPIMNNGITIIAKSLNIFGQRVTMSDFQIVNGCQTSNVIYDNRNIIPESMKVPIRVIHTTDETIIESVITATNRQTEVRQEQFFALKSVAKKLELFLKSFDISDRLYYERRTHQYDGKSIDRNRIVTHKDLVRAVGAMFLQLPHRTTRGYNELSARVGRDFFKETDKYEPYYVAGYALYLLNSAFISGAVAASNKIARYQILLVVRLMMDQNALPQLNSNEMSKRCEAMTQMLHTKGVDIILGAAAKLSQIVGGEFDRDSIHSQSVTDAILDEFGQRSPGRPSGA